MRLNIEQMAHIEKAFFQFLILLSGLTVANIFFIRNVISIENGNEMEAKKVDITHAGDVFFSGSKYDPEICAEVNGKVKCCGKPEEECRGSIWLHPSMRSVADCLASALNLGGNQEKCPGGIGESFRGIGWQKELRSVAAGFSSHNYGLAFDGCSYFKSMDCSKTNLINVAAGGIILWKKGEEIKCQAKLRTKKWGIPVSEIAKVVTKAPGFEEIIKKVQSCYQKSGVKFGKWNWGIGWEDYFDAPHFQYFPSHEAGYYRRKKEIKNGTHFLVEILKDCYSGDRKSMLIDLYSEKTPESFLEKKANGCGARGFLTYKNYIAEWN